MTGIVGRVLAVVVAILAWRVADKRPHHRPLARWLSVAAVADVVGALLCWYLDRCGVPYSGLARVAHHAWQALGLVEPVGLAGVAWLVLGQRRTAPQHTIGAGALIWCVLVVGYPEPLRGPVMAPVWGWIEGASVVVTALAMVVWGRERRWPTMTELLIGLYWCVRVSLLVAGPYSATGGPLVAWWTGDGAQFVAVLVSLVTHLAWWRAIQ